MELEKKGFNELEDEGVGEVEEKIGTFIMARNW